MGCGASTGGSAVTVVQRDPAEESARATLEQALRDGELQAMAASNLQLGESAGASGLNHHQRLEYLEWRRAQEAKTRR